MKKVKILLLGIIATIMCATASVYADDITIMVNGNELIPETPAVIVEGRTLVPLRAITEALGCDVAWNAERKGITLTDGKRLYFTWIGRDTAFKTTGGAIESSTTMDVPPVIMNDYTMVPLRAISEMFGAVVDWDGGKSLVTVDYEKVNVTKGLAEEFMDYEEEFSKMYDIYKGYTNGTGKVVNAEIQLENGGVIGLELYSDIAPITVANFVKNANAKFYDGLIFHRVIEGFMIQGGGFDADMKHKEAETIKGEFLQNGVFNMIAHNRGAISMARTSNDMNSASSQFFIVHKDSSSLDGQYAAFGCVTNGMEYVDKIANVETTSVGEGEERMDDVPKEAQVIKTIVIK